MRRTPPNHKSKYLPDVLKSVLWGAPLLGKLPPTETNAWPIYLHVASTEAAGLKCSDPEIFLGPTWISLKLGPSVSYTSALPLSNAIVD